MTTPSVASPHLVQSFPHWRRVVVGLIGFLTAFLVFCWWEARLPDETLSFSRETLSHSGTTVLTRKLENVSEWKNWFYSLKEARLTGTDGATSAVASQKAFVGAHVELQMDPGKGASHRFLLAAEITQYEPGKLLVLKLTDDSSGKIFKLFDQLEWKIELSPANDGIHILGTETAHTTHWRSRLFARLSPRVILNQLFYPNLMVLANPETPPKAEGIF